MKRAEHEDTIATLIGACGLADTLSAIALFCSHMANSLFDGEDETRQEEAKEWIRAITPLDTLADSLSI